VNNLLQLDLSKDELVRIAASEKLPLQDQLIPTMLEHPFSEDS
jgi:hypothetical protein